MIWTQTVVVALYVVAGLLPLAGFGHSFTEHSLWKRHEKRRKAAEQRLTLEFNKKWQSATNLERDNLLNWHQKELSQIKVDRNGKRINDGLVVMGGERIRKEERHRALLRDVKYVGSGVIFGSVASIISVIAL